jgi:hypothetical protein
MASSLYYTKKIFFSIKAEWSSLLLRIYFSVKLAIIDLLQTYNDFCFSTRLYQRFKKSRVWNLPVRKHKNIRFFARIWRKPFFLAVKRKAYKFLKGNFIWQRMEANNLCGGHR